MSFGLPHAARFSALFTSTSAIALIALGMAAPAQAAAGHYGVTISTAATKNMSFSNGVYAATDNNAVLNVTDLQTALASGNVEVTTGDGSGGGPGNLQIAAPITWASAYGLTLDAYASIFVDRTLVDAGSGALTLKTGDGSDSGALTFGSKGSIGIWSLTDVLTINGQVYTLVNSVATLAAAPRSSYIALAASYNAKPDGVYTSAPVSAWFSGTFEGLGNTISNLTISDSTDNYAGLFSAIMPNGDNQPGLISDFGLVNANVTAQGISAGALVGYSASGAIRNSYATGKVSQNSTERAGGNAGGLVGMMDNSNDAGATIANSYAEVTVSEGGAQARAPLATGGRAGGLVGQVDYSDFVRANNLIEDSYATGSVTAGANADVGGLVGMLDAATVENSFATGAAVAGNKGSVGGLIGVVATNSHEIGVVVENSYAEGNAAGGTQGNIGGLVGLASQGSYTSAYSTGAAAATKAKIGGFIGNEAAAVTPADAYWDTTTSGVANPVGTGSGSGITGLTTAQLQAALPAGFDSSVWGQSPSINNGLPYLIANPPPQ